MDTSSVYAMARMIDLKERFAIVCASDTDAGRHGIVSHSRGLLPPNYYLAVAIDSVFTNRPQWPKTAAVGKTLVSNWGERRQNARRIRHGRELPQLAIAHGERITFALVHVAGRVGYRSGGI